MLLENETLIIEQKRLDMCTKILLAIPALSISIWCLTNATFSILMYEHIRNILRNVTIHVKV